MSRTITDIQNAVWIDIDRKRNDYHTWKTSKYWPNSFDNQAIDVLTYPLKYFLHSRTKKSKQWISHRSSIHVIRVNSISCWQGGHGYQYESVLSDVIDSLRRRRRKRKKTFYSVYFQTLTFEAAGSHYILEAEVCNEGVKYSDTFSLSIRYCLVQTCITTTNLRVSAHVHFSKPVNSILKRSLNSCVVGQNPLLLLLFRIDWEECIFSIARSVERSE